MKIFQSEELPQPKSMLEVCLLPRCRQSRLSFSVRFPCSRPLLFPSPLLPSPLLPSPPSFLPVPSISPLIHPPSPSPFLSFPLALTLSPPLLPFLPPPLPLSLSSPLPLSPSPSLLSFLHCLSPSPLLPLPLLLLRQLLRPIILLHKPLPLTDTTERWTRLH